MGRRIQGLPRLFSVQTGREVDFNVFTDVNTCNALIAHVFKGLLDGGADWIEHRFFWSNDELCFHSEYRQTGESIGATWKVPLAWASRFF